LVLADQHASVVRATLDEVLYFLDEAFAGDDCIR